MKEARLRRDLIGGELAAGRNPADLLQAMLESRRVRTFADLYDEFTASRVDVAEATKINDGTHRIRLVDLLGDSDPQTIGWQDVQRAVSSLADDLSPLSVRNYLGTLRLVLDFADLDPNPARDRRVKLPRPEENVPNPPTAAEVAAGIANYSPHDLRHRFISVKIREGVPVTQVAAHVGHSRKSPTLDTYAHVLIDD
jgi:Phage integrase family